MQELSGDLISLLQAWQDYLEETMQKEKSGKTTIDDRFRKELKPDLSLHFESFFEENNLSANEKSEFIHPIKLPRNHRTTFLCKDYTLKKYSDTSNAVEKVKKHLKRR